jgi:hypothetical protein
MAGDRSDEEVLHERFSKSLIRGEWFEATPELLMLCAEVGLLALEIVIKPFTTTITVDDEFKAKLVSEGGRLGVGWTTALQILARERLEQKENERRK